MPIEMNTEMTSPEEERRQSHPPLAVPYPDPAHAKRAPRRSLRGLWIALVVLAIVLAVGIVAGIASRHSAEHHLAQSTERNAVLNVTVTHPTVQGSAAEIALPGNIQAFNDTPIYARTSGYLKQWFTDIGTHVHKGQLMAIIGSPEIDEQLQQAQANLQLAQADLALANTTSERYQKLLQQDSVSRQETDVAVSQASSRRASVAAASANVRRLQQLQSFERIYAPFAGVVTTRNTDIGALIDAGSGSTQPRDLFRIASVDQLRVFVAVPEIYAPAIRNGEHATLTLDEYPGQTFTGTVARNSSAIDPNTRTLNVEVDVDNSKHMLLPGAYTFVHFKLPQSMHGSPRQLSVPSDTLLFRAQGTQVALVRDGHVHLQGITIGQDRGSTLEIATGLTPSDMVIVNPADSLAEGQPVHVANGPTEPGEDQ